MMGMDDVGAAEGERETRRDGVGRVAVEVGQRPQRADA
jgi:hypothetical protein